MSHYNSNRNRLAEFASSQVEAITDVLQMVARDRRRVQALLRDVESPSLRRYLEEWLEATPASYIDDNDESSNSNDYDSAASTVEETADNKKKRSTRNNNSHHCCCPCGCWKKANAAQRSFWDILESSPSCVRQQYDHWIKQHNQQRGRLAYGVSYEWLTEPMSISGGSTPQQNSRFDWEDVDHFFQGKDISFIDHLEGNPEATSVFIQQANIVSDSSWYRIVQIPDTLETNTFLFGGEKSAFPTVQEVLSSSKTTTTTEEAVKIYYDIVFYAAEHDCLLRHQRTAKGSLVFTAKERNCGNASQDNEGVVVVDVDDATVHHQYRSDAFAENASGNNHNHNGKGNWVLQGTVRMDSCMDALDVVPFGGNFTFEESTRFERVISEQAEADEWEHSSTSVVSVRVTEPPVGLSRLIAPRHDSRSSSRREQQQPQTQEAGSVFRGEMRVVQERTAARLLSRKDVMAQNDPTIGRTGFTDPDSVLSPERAQQKLTDYRDRMCLWMHRHTNLPRDVICRIGQYASPPPVFFLERGDLVIDIDWSPSAEQEEGEDRDDALDFISTSCIVARPRRKY